MDNDKRKIMLLVFLGVIIISGVIIAVNMLPSIFFSFKEAPAIGIIGGADGPTVIYITPSGNWTLVLLFSLLLIAIDLILLAVKKIIEHKKEKKIGSKYFVLFILIFNIVIILLLFPVIVLQLLIVNAIIALLYLVFAYRSNGNREKH